MSKNSKKDAADIPDGFDVGSESTEPKPDSVAQQVDAQLAEKKPEDQVQVKSPDELELARLRKNELQNAARLKKRALKEETEIKPSGELTVFITGMICDTVSMKLGTHWKLTDQEIKTLNTSSYVKAFEAKYLPMLEKYVVEIGFIGAMYSIFAPRMAIQGQIKKEQQAAAQRQPVQQQQSAAAPAAEPPAEADSPATQKAIMAALGG
jgi:hypothetical protein